MKTKRFIGSVFAFLLSAALLAGCAAAPAAPEVRREVNVILLADYLGDLSYNDGIVQELRLAEERYRDSSEIELTVRVFEMLSDDGSGNERDEMEAAFQEDSDLIVVATYTILPFIEPAAAFFADKDFILLDMEATGPNIYSALFKANESSYLCGALAAKMSDTGVIGIIIGVDIPALHDFCVGYILGALYVNPDVKVIVSTVGNFYDAEIGYELAASQFERGVDVCFSAAGGAGLGSIMAASDFGRYSIGVDIDQTEQVEPELRDAILTSGLKNFDSLVAVLIDDYLSGSLSFGESGRFGLKEGAVGIARNQFYLNMTPLEIQGEIDAIEEKIISGEIYVPSAFEMTQAEIEELFRSVRP